MRPHTKSPSNVNKAFYNKYLHLQANYSAQHTVFFKNRKVLTQKPYLFKLKPKST